MTPRARSGKWSRTTSPGVPRGRRPERQRGLRFLVRQRAPLRETGPWEATLEALALAFGGLGDP